MKKLLYLILGIIIGASALNVSAQALRVMTAPQGGTGVGSVTAGDVGNCLAVADDSPFTWEIVACGSGSGGSGNVATSSAETSGRVPFWTSTAGTPATLSGGVAGFTWTAASSLLTATNLSSTNSTSTNQDVTGLFTFDGITGSEWLDFCEAITGGSGLCDGVDNTGSGGSGLATSTAIADTYVIYGTSESDVGAEAAFTYDDSTNVLTVDNIAFTNATGTVIRVGDGTNTSPSFGFTGDTGHNTGLYLGGQNVLSFSAGGTSVSLSSTGPALRPNTDDAVDLGNVSQRWRDLWVSRNATTTNATSTNFFATTASTTNLAVGTSFNFLGTVITNVSTWFNGLFDARATSGNGVTVTSGTFDFDCSDVTDSSATDGIGCSSEDLVVSVTADNFADDDWGDLSVSGNSVTLDADVVGTAEMADADHGDFTYSGGVATLDADVVSTAEMADADFGDWTCSSGSCTLDADTVAANELADDQILEVHLDATNAASDNQILSFDNASGGFTWVDDATGAGTFGTDNQIPFTNAGGDDFDYSANLTFDGSLHNVIGQASSTDLLVTRNATTTYATTTVLSATTASTTNLVVSNSFRFFTELWSSLTEFATYIRGLFTGGTGITLSSGDISFDCSEVEGTGINCVGEAITLDTTGLITTSSVLDDLAQTTLADPGADQIVFWDDSDTAFEFLSTLTGLSISGNTLTVTDVTCTDCLNATEIEDIYLLNNGDAGTGVFDFGGATSLEIPNGTGPTMNAIGQIALDTTSNNWIGATTTSGHVVIASATTTLYAFSGFASTSVEFVSGGIMDLPSHPLQQVATKLWCKADGGTSVQIFLSDGTNDTNTITCTTTGTEFALTANNTWTAYEAIRFEVGTVTGAVDYLSMRVMGYRTSN